MDPQRFDRIEELFEAARHLQGDDRAALLNRECSDDPSLRDEIITLLRHHEESKIALDRPVVGGSSELGRIALTAPKLELRAPDRIGRYRILGVLGEGGFGIVYRAEQDHPRRDVAVKVLRTWLQSGHVLRRFEFEAEILGRLRHPGIAQIFEAGTAEVAGRELPFLAMELIDGRPLTEYAKEHRLTVRDRLDLFAKVCDAVQHAHQHGVIHRDLKPANILVEEGSGLSPRRLFDGVQGSVETDPPIPPLTKGGLGGVGWPKVLDFGVARVINSDVQMTTMQTGVGQLIGTLAYMSPEQLGGDPNQIDTRSDVYSLGVVLYELLTGNLPYELKNLSALDAIQLFRDSEPARSTRMSTVLKGDLRVIVAKALAKEKPRRYQSAAELGDDLRRYVAGDAISARRDSSWYVFKKTVQRYRIAVAVAAAFVLLLAASSIVLSVLYQRQGQLLIDVKRENERAVSAEDQATRRFNEVRDLAHTFIYDFHDRVVDLAGATPVREFLVTTALDYLNRLAAEAGDDRDVLKELAEAYAKIGNVQGNPNNPNLGDTEGALRSYERSVEMYDRLSEESPDDLAIRRSAAAARLSLGDMLQQLGRSPEALRWHTECLFATKALAAEEPGVLDVQRDLAQAHLKVGFTLARMGKVEEAVAEQRTCLDIRRPLAAGPEATLADRRDLAAVLLHLGDRMTETNDPRGALAFYEESRDIRQALVDEDPQNATDRRALAVTWTRIGNVQGNPLQRRPNLGDVDAAAESYAKGLAIFQQLSEADPADMRAKRDLSVSYEKLGDIETVRKRHEAAVEHYRETLAISLALLEKDPGSVLAKEDMITSEVRVAMACADVERREEGLAFLERAVTFARELVQSDPDVIGHEYLLAWVYGRFGEFFESFANREGASPQEALADWREAVPWYQRSYDIYAAMRDRGALLAADEEAPKKRMDDIERCQKAIRNLTEPSRLPSG